MVLVFLLRQRLVLTALADVVVLVHAVGCERSRTNTPFLTHMTITRFLARTTLWKKASLAASFVFLVASATYCKVCS